MDVFNGENRATIACYIDAANSCTCCDDDPFNAVCAQREEQGAEKCPGEYFYVSTIAPGSNISPLNLVFLLESL